MSDILNFLDSKVKHLDVPKKAIRKNRQSRTAEKHIVQFEIRLLTVSNLSDQYEGWMIYLQWRRGSRNSGTTKRALVSKKRIAPFEEKLVIDASLIKMDDYASCMLSFKLIGERNKHEIDKGEIDLSKYVGTEPVEETIDFKHGLAKLKFIAVGNIIRINDKAIDRSNELQVGENSSSEKHDLTNKSESSFTSSGEARKRPESLRSLIHPHLLTEHNGSSHLNKANNHSDEAVEALQAKIKQQAEEILKLNAKVEAFHSILKSKNSSTRNSEDHTNNSSSTNQSSSSPNDDKNLKNDVENLHQVIASLRATNIKQVEKIESLQKKLNSSNGGRDQDTDYRMSDSNTTTTLSSNNTNNSSVVISPPPDEQTSDPMLEEIQKKVKMALSQPSSWQSSSSSITSSSSSANQPRNSAQVDDEMNDVKSMKEEMTIRNTLYNLVYNSDMVVEEDKLNGGIKMPSLSLRLVEWLSAETSSMTKSKPKILTSMYDTIQRASVRVVPNTALECDIYWLSTISIILHFFEKSKVNSTLSEVAKTSKEFEKLAHTVFSKLVSRIKEAIAPHIVSTFTSSELLIGNTQKGFNNNNKSSSNDVNNNNKRKVDVKSLAASTSNPFIHSVSTWNLSDLINYLEDLLSKLKRFALPIPLISRIFKSIVGYINIIIFNALIMRSDLCTTGTAMQIKMTISQFDSWMSGKLVKPLLGDALSQLKLVIEAVTMLTLDKSILLHHSSVIKQISPSLTIQQVRLLVSSFQPDSLCNEPVSPKVLELLDKLCDESQETKDDVVELQDVDIDPVKNPLDFSFVKQPLNILLPHPSS
eukprot:TRINITY_DN3212_c0_g2_i3.p1 TRINITY_DN3212_c0_g2~~TRINITY_DN3212_c0_g2_i3.p1  ORF type:complete len:814 (-),score=236.69 TRINITY_DN3212_c0_g2_i3:140-2581(-)